MDKDAAARRQSQAALYGEPLAEVVASITGALGLNQGQLAKVLGVSAPMLSHLVSARRVKVGNPLAHSRLVQLRTLSADVAAGRVSRADATSVVEQIASTTDSWATGTRTSEVRAATDATSGHTETEIVGRVQALFRNVAAASDWLDAAAQVESLHPNVAELLRTYGAARTATAEEHWKRNLH